MHTVLYKNAFVAVREEGKRTENRRRW